MLMVEMKRMMNMRDYFVFLMPFFPNRKEHGHELRVVKKFPVTRLQRRPSRVQSLDE